MWASRFCFGKLFVIASVAVSTLPRLCTSLSQNLPNPCSNAFSFTELAGCWFFDSGHFCPCLRHAPEYVCRHFSKCVCVSACLFVCVCAHSCRPSLLVGHNPSVQHEPTHTASIRLDLSVYIDSLYMYAHSTYAYTYVYKYTCMHTSTHLSMHACMQVGIYSFICLFMLMCIRSFIYPLILSCVRSRIPSCVHAFIHGFIYYFVHSIIRCFALSFLL